MAFEHDTTDDSVSNVRKQRRQQEDRRRMAYRRAIEQYQESKALHALVSDFPELAGAAPEHQRLH
ncbi:MAG: hypothetical protein V7751_20170 [Pseudoalteromonas distincta]|jgi:hypothetical protein|tara:strand:- start:61314 stop:61508 length:195 start_codon:yes stop_codon:yes gene_type:complete